MNAWDERFARDRKAFDDMLDRVEAAQRDSTGYDFLDNAADVETTKHFVETWWNHLGNADQARYRARIAYLKAIGKGIR